LSFLERRFFLPTPVPTPTPVLVLGSPVGCGAAEVVADADGCKVFDGRCIVLLRSFAPLVSW
jgi:hypothetical protein